MTLPAVALIPRTAPGLGVGATAGPSPAAGHRHHALRENTDGKEGREAGHSAASTGPGCPLPPSDELFDLATRDDFHRWEAQLANTGNCANPIRLLGRIDATDRATGQTRVMYDTDSEPGQRPPDRVRQPPRARLPRLLAGLQERRPADHPLRPDRRQRHARHRGRAPVRLRHPHRPRLRARAHHPHRAAWPPAALPPPPRRPPAPLPTWPRHLLPPHPPSRRSTARPAAVPRLLRLHRARPVQRVRAGTVAPVHHLPAPPAGPPARDHPEAAAQQVRVRFVKVAEYQARGVVHYHAVVRLDGPGDDCQPPPAQYTATLLTQAIRQAAAVVSCDTATLLTQAIRGLSHPLRDTTPPPVMTRPWGVSCDSGHKSIPGSSAQTAADCPAPGRRCLPRR